MFYPIYRPIIWLTISMIVGILAGEAFPGYGQWVFLLVGGSRPGAVDLPKAENTGLVATALFSLPVSVTFLSNPGLRRASRIITFGILLIPRPVKLPAPFWTSLFITATEPGSLWRSVSIVQDGNPVPACGRLRVTVSNGPISLSRGDNVSFFGRLRSIRNFNNPGGFDYERYMAFQHIWARSYVVAEKLSVRSRGNIIQPDDCFR